MPAGERRRQRRIHLDGVVDVVGGQHRVSVGVRHARVDLGDDQPAAGPDGLDRGGQHVDLDAQGHVPSAGVEVCTSTTSGGSVSLSRRVPGTAGTGSTEARLAPRMPGPMNGDSSVTPSRSGTPAER